MNAEAAGAVIQALLWGVGVTVVGVMLSLWLGILPTIDTRYRRGCHTTQTNVRIHRAWLWIFMLLAAGVLGCAGMLMRTFWKVMQL